MAEQLKRDQNHVTVQGAVTDDSNQTVEMWRADATTKRLLVSAVVAGSQNGKILVDGADTTYEYLATKLVAGTGITLTVINPGGNETLEISSVGSIYYNIVQEDGVSVTQRTKLNFVNYFSINDNAGNTSTDVNLNIGAIEPALDLANIGGQINLATQVTGLLSSTNIDITDLESNLDLANIAGSIDLSTQVTGTLDVSNIDVVGIANDATFLATLIPNLDENVKVAVDGVTITGDGTTSNPLVAAVSSDNFTVKATAADTTPSYLDNKLNIHSTDGSVTVTKTITNPAGNEVVDYDLSTTGSVGSLINGNVIYGLTQVPTTGQYGALELSDGTMYSYIPGLLNQYCITPDKTKVYELAITYTIGSNYNIVLNEYTGNGNGSIGTLSATYTASSSHTVGTNNFEGSVFVNGSSVFVPLASGGFLPRYTEWAISGVSLVSPVTTNLSYSTLSNFANFYWFYDGTNYYTYNNGANDLITKFSYSAGTFTSLATAPLSTSIDTQTSYGTGIGIDPRMRLNFFKIKSGKIGNFAGIITASSTFTSPQFVSGVVYLENSTI